MGEWNVEHMREPDHGRCPVCGERFARAIECYPDAETSIPSGTRSCIVAGVASASPDPTLIRIDHNV